jgi:hypothetical protein
MRIALCAMVLIVASLLFVGCNTSPRVSDTESGPSADTPLKKTVEAACATCIYDMEDVQGCKLAVKLDGKPYLVSGSDVDAHSAGLCSGAKHAVVSGNVVGDKFVATSFEIEHKGEHQHEH